MTNEGLDEYIEYVRIVVLARRVSHSLEMANWIRLQVEILVTYPVFLFHVKKEVEYMDFIKGNMKSIYLKYLGAAFGSALITSIYSIVDMAMVGKSSIITRS